jgi:hypothetical protein
MKEIIPFLRRISIPLTLLLACVLPCRTALADAAVTVVAAPSKPGEAIPPGFSGLSFETSSILPKSGGYFFSATNHALLGTFRTLGIRNLRIGGNTADRATVKIPTEADLDSLFAFATAADVKVIYNLRLKEGDPGATAKLAKYMTDHYRSRIVSFTIGNEPNMYFTNFPAYRNELRKHMDAVSAAAPEARFCGASATPGKRNWAAAFAEDFGRDPRVNLITQHAYFGGAANRMTNAAAAQDKLLSPDMLKSYKTFYSAFMPAVLSNRLTCRFEEANSYFNGGARGASDAFAAALWALDYLHWWAARGGVDGFNFHMAGVYSAFNPSPSGFFVRPLGYGMKAFDLGSHGRVVPTQVVSNTSHANLTAYGVLGLDGLYVTLVNKEHGAAAQDASVTLCPDQRYSQAHVIFLTAPSGDVAAQSGLTLGGAPIKDDASWEGAWTPLPSLQSGLFTVKVPAASAAVVKMTNH